MIVTGKFAQLTRIGGSALLSFVIPDYMAKYLTLEEKDYKVEITELKSKRSLQQNKYMWKYIHEVAKKQGMDDDEVYCQLIEMANIEAEYLTIIPEAMQRLKERGLFRVLKIAEERISSKGVKTLMVKGYYGTSTFNTQEMSDFIDRLLDYCQHVGVDTSEFNE
jgi:predicted RNA methylase